MLLDPELHYLDNAATTMVDPEIAGAIHEALLKDWANPSRLFEPAVETHEALTTARGQIARTLGCQAKDLYFTSCGSESNNLALLGASRTRTFGKSIVVSGFEHPSVQRPLERLAKQGYDVTVVAPRADGTLDIAVGRHPVVEQTMSEGGFVPNDTHMNADDCRMCIITGPNMAGKSTYMRQVALIVLMAQIGSFVPARAARIGVVDRIFTRIGASDDLSAGQSTFMVEMSEVADILREATEKSLLILDEIGRGTSTYDGMSIARAVIEYNADRKKLGAKTLFATHYFELTQLPEKMEGVANVHLDALEHGDTIAFMHSVQDGAASKSYGLAVAALAGVPKEVIKRARQKLRELESISPNAAATQVDGTQMSLLSVPEETSPAVEALENLDPDSLTPRQALEWIYRLKSLV